MKKIMFNDRYGLTEAVLSGRKTQTRRIIKFSPIDANYVNDEGWSIGGYVASEIINHYSRYNVGEVVAVAQSYKDCGYGECAPIVSLDENGIATFGSDAGSYNKMFVRADLMPHQIRFTNVRVERLQDISDEDCTKEGIDKWTAQGKRYYGFFDNSKGVFSNHRTPREAYAALIDHISGKGTWESNPYVFVYDFELVK